jgi:flagellar motility protein MotE (MotC chaperone)
MSEDLTKKLPQSDRDTILKAIKDLETSLRSSIDNVVTWISSVDSRLVSLEQKVDQKLCDPRPIWNKVVEDMSKLQKGQDAMRSDLRKVNERLHRLELRRNP